MTEPATNTHADAWLDAYGQLRPGCATDWREWLSILLSVSGLIGVLWTLPVPQIFAESGIFLNWATMFLMASVVYYFILSIGLGVGCLPLIVLFAAVGVWLDGLPGPAWPSALALIVAGVSWDLIELKRNRRTLRPIRLISHVMLGPPWLIAGLFRRNGLSY
jgi:hypothetical protein